MRATLLLGIRTGTLPSECFQSAVMTGLTIRCYMYP